MGFIAGASYPLTSATTLSLAEQVDPLLIACLRYLKACLSYHLQSRWTAELTRTGLTLEESDGYICSTLVPYDLTVWGNQEHLVFPVLALHRDSELFNDRTLITDAINGTWILRFLLPPMTAEHARVLTPILKAASRVMAMALDQGFMLGVNSGSPWSTGLGLQRMKVIDCRYEPRGFEGSNNVFPSIVMRIEVEEFFSYLPSDWSSFDGIDGYVQSAGVADGYSGDDDPVDVALFEQTNS